MKHINRGVVAGCVLAVFVFAALGMAAEAPRTQPTPSQTKLGPSAAQLVLATRLQALTHDSFAGLTAMGEANGQRYGAGAGTVGIIGDSGLVNSFSIPVQRPTGLAGFGANKLILGDASNNSVFAVDTNTKQASKLFGLNELNARGIQDPLVLQSGRLGGLAFDGKFIYAGVAAGYSSSILKIDPTTKSVVSQVYAPGPNPIALQFYKGNLFVLEGNRQNIRRFDSSLQLSEARSDVDVQDGKGLIMSDEGAEVLSPGRKAVERYKLNISQLIQSPTRAQIVSAVIAGSISIVVPALPQKYAVLICGDWAQSGFDEFWGDTVWMYKMLRAKGYSKENIYVLYANGVDYACANPFYTVPGETVTDFAATPANVRMVFDGLKNGDDARGIKKMTSRDSLFIWTFDHGGGGPTNSYLCLWGGTMTDTEFAAKANAVPYAKRAIFMQQCRSGGFIDNLANSQTFISTACKGSENAYQADTENEYYGGKWYHHGEYNYYIIGALNGKYPNGATAAAAGADGKCSAWEAHQWEASHENRTENPQHNNSTLGTTFFLN